MVCRLPGSLVFRMFPTGHCDLATWHVDFFTVEGAMMLLQCGTLMGQKILCS
jgi:hypothetical protein